VAFAAARGDSSAKSITPSFSTTPWSMVRATAIPSYFSARETSETLSLALSLRTHRWVSSMASWMCSAIRLRSWRMWWRTSSASASPKASYTLAGAV
jgi:hypothetical protein